MYRFCFISSLYILLLSFLFSCSPEKQKEAQPPLSPPSTSSYKLEIQPLEATRDSTFYISSKGLDLSRATIQWLVNGLPVENASGLQFRSTDVKKGDKVQARILINNDEEIVSDKIIIKNTPPAITKAKILPAFSKAGDTLKIDAAVIDRDDDEVSLSYEWYKNGEPSGKGKSFEGPFKRGDKISVRLTPFDGEEYGRPVTISTEIFNSPPHVLTGGTEKFQNNIYSYQLKAIDPDGDTLTYSLKQAPEGMTVDKTGLITWKVTDEEAKRHPVTVLITDEHGGEIKYNFDVVISIH
ncbi:MAG: hypothetical protein HXY47_02340 [Nitrospirae bacterium]|nr:hypothetical protein [Nitrospirota bacterium]